MNNEDTSKKIKENKYKILRMSLILGNVIDDKESLDNFETAAREIDAMNGEEYLDSIEDKYYNTDSLEKEKNRLEDLVAFIEGRLAQRKALEEDFYNVAGYPLTDLDEIKDSNRLDEYKNRLAYIDKYLSNKDIIDKTTKDRDKYKRDLEKAYETKENNEENNIKLEKDLSDLFKKIINDNTIILRNVEQIDKELADINPAILESKKTMDIFDKSFRTLKKAGISGREEKEYYSYVSNVREDYYDKMERYFLLSLYRLIFVICSEFEDIYNKRNKIREILDDRISLRNNLGISEEDKLSRLYNLIDSQYKEILDEEENINNISILKNKVNDCEVELDKYKEDNQRVEILDLLKEFSLIKEDNKDKVYSSSDFGIDLGKYNIDSSENNKYIVDSKDKDLIIDKDLDVYDVNEILEKDIPTEEKEEVKDNQIVSVSEPTGLDIVKVTNKTKNVMIKVGEMLNPKPAPVIEEVIDTTSGVNKEPVVNKVSKEEKQSDVSFDNLELPSFDDLPTVSSLTNDGSINPITNNSSSNTTSFWGNNNNDFEFPDINSWEEE